MNARFYSPNIGRFASADTIVPDPQNPQSYNRYSYVNNTPTLMVDPSGHNPILPPICLPCMADELRPQLTEADLVEYFEDQEWAVVGKVIRDYLYVEGYGLIDGTHVSWGYDVARLIFLEIHDAIVNNRSKIIIDSNGFTHTPDWHLFFLC